MSSSFRKRLILFSFYFLKKEKHIYFLGRLEIESLTDTKSHKHVQFSKSIIQILHMEDVQVKFNYLLFIDTFPFRRHISDTENALNCSIHLGTTTLSSLKKQRMCRKLPCAFIDKQEIGVPLCKMRSSSLLPRQSMLMSFLNFRTISHLYKKKS